MTALTSTDTLASGLRGSLLLPGTPGFDHAATPWNLAVRQPVAAVVEAADADDVATVVRHASDAGLAVAAQSTGHGATGDVAGAVLLRTGRLDDVTVDPAGRTARVGAGATWAAVQARTAPHGLTGLLGSAPGVGVTGYTLGGGLGWFSRAHGLAAYRVRSFDVVAADGEPRTVTATPDPDLFWALRGGGGDLAVVTALEIDLVEVPTLTGGGLVWPAERAGDVLDAYREVTAAAPRELSVWLTRVEPPGAPAMVAMRVTEPYLLYALGLAHAPGLAAAVGERLDRLPADLGNLATGRTPATFLSPGEHVSAAYAPDALARLQGLKRSRDPQGTIRGGYPLLG